MRPKIVAIGLGICGLGGLIGWLLWWPVKNYLFSLIPQTQWAGFIKLVIVLGVGYFGGIVLPLAIIGLGIFFLVSA